MDKQEGQSSNQEEPVIRLEQSHSFDVLVAANYLKDEVVPRNNRGAFFQSLRGMFLGEKRFGVDVDVEKQKVQATYSAEQLKNLFSDQDQGQRELQAKTLISILRHLKSVDLSGDTLVHKLMKYQEKGELQNAEAAVDGYIFRVEYLRKELEILEFAEKELKQLVEVEKTSTGLPNQLLVQTYRSDYGATTDAVSLKLVGAGHFLKDLTEDRTVSPELQSYILKSLGSLSRKPPTPFG